MNNETCGCGTREKTSSTKGVVRINCKEDFELVIELLTGDKPYQLGDEDFRVNFTVTASYHIVGRTAGVCERRLVDGSEIRCFMDAHGLPPGELRAEVKVNTPDLNYADGERLNVAIVEGTVLLVKDNIRFDGTVVKAKIHVVMIDTYDLAKEHGYKGTIDEYYSTFTEVGHLKENIRGTPDEMTKVEKLRTDAEMGRAKAETQRQDAEKLRKQAEMERGNSEKKRMLSEKEKSTAFSSIQESIGPKIKEVNAATSNLKSIIGMDKGVLLSTDLLKTAYPSPQVGFSAKVGTELPYAIYIREVPGTWKDSGATYAPTT